MSIMKEHEHEGPMNEELKALEAHMLSISKQGLYWEHMFWHCYCYYYYMEEPR